MPGEGAFIVTTAGLPRRRVAFLFLTTGLKLLSALASEGCQQERQMGVFAALTWPH